MNKEELFFALRGRVNSGDRFVKNINAGDGQKLELPNGCPGRCGGMAVTRPRLSLLAKALALPTQSLWIEGRSGPLELRPESEGKLLVAAFTRLGMRA